MQDPFEGSWDDDLANLLQDVVTEENPAMTAEKYSADTVSNAYQDDDDDDLGDEDDDQDNDDGLRRSTRRRQPAPRSETPETEDLVRPVLLRAGCHTQPAGHLTDCIHCMLFDTAMQFLCLME